MDGRPCAHSNGRWHLDSRWSRSSHSAFVNSSPNMIADRHACLEKMSVYERDWNETDLSTRFMRREAAVTFDFKRLR